MRRDIIIIDEAKCNGCGLCVPQCAEGAIAIVDGKAKLVRDSYCDGLGACLGHCPEGAITIEAREAEAFDEARVATLHGSKHQPSVARKPLLRLVDKAEMSDCDGGGCAGSRALAFLPQSASPHQTSTLAPVSTLQGWLDSSAAGKVSP